MSTELAKAYVQIIPSTQGISGGIASLLGDEAAGAGTTAGQTFSGSFGKSLASDLSSTVESAKTLIKPAVSGFNALESVGKSAANAILRGVKAFAGASTAVAGVGATAVKTGAAFDAKMSEVQAIAGATGADFTALRNKAIEMGAATKFSASESAEAMTYMGMAGWKTQDIISGIPGILNLAAASGEDLATTSDIVTDALTAFNLTAADSNHFADVLAAASTNANTNVRMMGESFKYVAPIAGSLDIGVEEIAESLGLMANSGIKASNAGTAMRSVLTRLSTNAGKSSKSLGALDVLTQELGVDFYDAAGRVRNFNDVLDDARAAWAKLGDQQQISYAKIIAGQYAMSGWLALMNSGAEDIDKLRTAIAGSSDEMDGFNGAAERMARTMTDNLAGDVTLLKSAFESLQIMISDSVTPTLREFAQLGQKAISAMVKGFSEGGAVGLANSMRDVISSAVATVSVWLPKVAEVGSRLVVSIVMGIVDAQDRVIAAAEQIIKSFSWGMGYLLENYLPRIAGFGIKIVNTIFEGFMLASQDIHGFLREFVPMLAEGFAKYHEAIMVIGLDLLGALGRGIVENKDRIQEIASNAISNIADAISRNAGDIVDGAIALVNAIAGAFMENKDKLLAAGAKIVAHLAEGLSTSAPAMATAAALLLPYILDVVKAVGTITSVVKDVIGIFGQAEKAASALGTGLSFLAAHPIALAVAAVAAFAAGIVHLYKTNEEFRNWVNGAWESIKSTVSGAVAGITTALGGVVDFFKNNWQDILLFLVSPFAEGFKLLYEHCDAFRGFIDGLIGKIKDAWNALPSFFAGLWDKIKSLFSGVGAWFGDVFTAAKESAATAFGGVTDKLGDVMEKIKSIFDPSALIDTGKQLVEGLWKGISGAWLWLKEKVRGLVNGLVNSVKGVLGVHSPSRVFAEIGGDLALGLGEGWAAEFSGVREQIDDGLRFDTAALRASAVPAASGRAPSGGNTYNFYSPTALDPVSAARELKKTSQRLALGHT